MRIPFTKAHGAGNDFLISPEHLIPSVNRQELARAICHRQQGLGADGWYLVSQAGEGDDFDVAIQLFNSDGSDAEISGNGTRCVAAWLAAKEPGRTSFRVRTGAGIRELWLQQRDSLSFHFSMTMGQPVVLPEEEIAIPGSNPLHVRGRRVDVGNPQYAIRVSDFDFPWKERGALLESHDAFPNRCNISFYRVRQEGGIEARFFERGAGATLSSGTGSTGVVAAALADKLVRLPVTVHTEAGPLEFRDEGHGLVLEGWSAVVGDGVFYWMETEESA